MKKIFLISVIFTLVLQNALLSQTLSSSPLSRYGVGDIYFQGNGRQYSMGNTGIADYTQFQISKINPASLAAIKPNSVIFDFSAFNRISNFNTGSQIQTNNITNFKSLMGGFRVTPWWHTAFGITPYSGVGYKIALSDSVVADDATVDYDITYEGSGGITQLFWSNSVSFLRHFSLGATVNYNFGYLKKNALLQIDDTISTSATNYEDKIYIKGLTYNFGALFQDTIIRNDKNILKYSIGGIYSNKRDLNAIRTSFIVRAISAYDASFTDTISFDTTATAKVSIPQTYGAGVSFTVMDKLTLSGDYVYSKWSETNFFGESSFSDSKYYGIGMEFCINPYSTIYYKTIRYRLGAYQYDSYRVYNNIQQQTQALTLGIGIPVRAIQLNLGFTYGKTGSIDLGLQENFYEFNLSVSMYDVWFIKRKYM